MKKLAAIGGGALAAIAGFFLWATRPTPAGVCRNIIAQTTDCIASIPGKAPIQCQECLAEGRAKALDAGVSVTDCDGFDWGEAERSCF